MPIAMSLKGKGEYPYLAVQLFTGFSYMAAFISGIGITTSISSPILIIISLVFSSPEAVSRRLASDILRVDGPGDCWPRRRDDKFKEQDGKTFRGARFKAQGMKNARLPHLDRNDRCSRSFEPISDSCRKQKIKSLALQLEHLVYHNSYLEHCINSIGS